MKPKNATLGASPLRVSRVTDIDVDNKAWDSVVFQQSKSLLDFDLNVMQRIMQDSIRKLSQSLVPSGFVSTVKILQPVSNNSIIYLAPNRVSVSGTILRIIDPNGSTQTIDGLSYPKCIKIDSSSYNDGTLSTSNSVFVWIESWFQEIAPSLVDESFDGVSTTEKKLTTVYQYGNDPNTYETNFPNGNTATNELKDTTFGAETTRRIQVRWRIRLSPKINSNTYTTGFSDQNATLSSNPLIWAQGGRKNCVFSASFSNSTMSVTAVTSGYVAIGMTITGPGVPDNTYVSAFQSGASGGVGNYTISQSFSLGSRTVFGWFTKSYAFTRSDKLTDTNANDFILDSDQNVYIAGSGSPSDALALNTVDGRVYGIPLGFFTSTGTFSNIAPNSSPQNALGTISATSVSLGLNNLRLNANSIGIASATGQSPAAGSGPLTVDTGTGTVTFNSPLAIGGTSLVSATTFNASAPALRFAGTGNPSTSGLYYDTNASIELSGVMVSDKGTLVAAFNKDGGLTVQNSLPINAKYLKVYGFYNASTQTVNFASGRYLGTWDGINSGAFTAPINANLSAGDFVINTGGYLHIYTGSAWVLGGTNTGQPNNWTALNSFGYATTHTTASTYTENLYLGANAIVLLPASSGLTYPAIRSMAITGSAFSTTTANTTVSSASNLHIVGLPYRGGTVSNLSTFKSYGILIDGGVDTSSTEAYGIYVNKSTYSTTATSVYYGAGFSSSQTSATTNITNVRILSSDTSTSTSDITKTGLEIISSGTWSGSTGSQTNRALYIDASGGKTNYAAIFNSGQVGIGTSTPTAGFALDVNGTIRSASGITVATGGIAVSGGKVTISDATAGSSTDGSLQLSGGLKIAKASYFGDSVTIATNGLSVSGGKVTISDATAGTSTDASLQLTGGLKTGETSYFGKGVTINSGGLAISGGKVTISDTTAGSSTDGSLQLSGGLKTAKASYFGDAVTIAANGLTISGGGINVSGSAQGALAPRAFIPAVAFIPDTSSGPSITVSNGIYVQQFSGATQYSYAYFQAPTNWARNSIKIAIYGVDASGVTWTVNYINGAPSTTFTTPVGTATTISSKSGTTSITEADYTTISLNSEQTLPAVGTGITLRIYAPSASGTAISTLYGASIIFA